jgi:hypothetical protein
MPDDIGANALVGGVLSAAILDARYSKGVLSLDETRALLMKALTALGPSMQTPQGFSASRLIGELLRGTYSARE